MSRNRAPPTRSQLHGASMLVWSGASSAWSSAPSTNGNRRLRGSRFLPRLSATAGVSRSQPNPTCRVQVRSVHYRKEVMHRSLKLLVILIQLGVLAVAQDKPAPSHAAAKPAASGPVLPSEEVVNAFLQQTFGYDSSLSWKITSIKPSEAAGLAEVDVTIVGPQGAGGQKFYVSPDGRHAVVREILPFGARPYDETRRRLEKGVNGPSRGPATAPVTVVEFSDLQCPHCKEAQPTLDRLVSENTNVRLVFQHFPLPMHDWAAKAAAYADCVGRSSPDAFWKFTAS